MSETSLLAPQKDQNESSQKEKESIIERFQNERLKLWKKMAKRMKEHPRMAQVLSAAANATSGSYIKLTTEAWKGKTIDQQSLTPLGRLMHAFMVTTGLSSYALLAAGRPEIAAITYASSWAGYALMYGPELLSPTLRAAADKIQNEHTHTAHILRTVAATCESSKKLFFKQP